MTAFNSKEGGFHKTPVGRVQTPTLAILVEREERIRAFRSRDYWEVEGEFAAVAGTYRGRWFDEKFRKPTTSTRAPSACGTSSQGRGDLRKKCLGKHGTVEEESKPTTKSVTAALRPHLAAARGQRPLRLFRQDHAGLAQALYEKHKALTYPRTDSALPAGGLHRPR
jgi:DNA topoisomerase-3